VELESHLSAPTLATIRLVPLPCSRDELTSVGGGCQSPSCPLQPPQPRYLGVNVGHFASAPCHGSSVAQRTRRRHLHLRRPWSLFGGRDTRRCLRPSVHSIPDVRTFGSGIESEKVAPRACSLAWTQCTFHPVWNPVAAEPGSRVSVGCRASPAELGPQCPQRRRSGSFTICQHRSATK
jgi:hypothetical protein